MKSLIRTLTKAPKNIHITAHDIKLDEDQKLVNISIGDNNEIKSFTTRSNHARTLIRHTPSTASLTISVQ